MFKVQKNTTLDTKKVAMLFNMVG